MNSNAVFQSARAFFVGPVYTVETMNSDSAVYVAYRTYTSQPLGMGQMLAGGWVYVGTVDGDDYFITDRLISAVP